MIVDLNIQGKTVVIIGGGNEAQKRVNSLLNQDCNIVLISDLVNPEIGRLAKRVKIKVEKERVTDTKFISKFNPDIIIATTNDKDMNQNIIRSAKRRKIIAYSSDSPETSDFSNPAVIDLENIVQIAIFTGGQSPAMSKKIKANMEDLIKTAITEEDLAQIKIQKIVRKMAKEVIPTQIQRKECLHSIMNDNEIDQLIKDGQMKKAEKRAITILRNWK